MNCDEVQELMSSAIDLEAPSETRELVGEHLSECPACAESARVLKELDQQLRSIASSANNSNRITAGVLSQWTPTVALAPQAAASNIAVSSPRSRWALLVSALSLLIGVVIWQLVRDDGQRDPLADNDVFPVGDDEPILPQFADASASDAADNGVARLVHTSGTVEVKYLDRDEWLPVSFTPFACPSDATVRTGESSLCEVETSSGGIVRLDEHATVHVRSAEEIELEAGRIWCKAPEDGSLQLTPALAEFPVPEEIDAASCRTIPLLNCPANCSMQAELTDSTELQVHAMEGLVDVDSDPFDRQLSSGEAVQIVAGRVDREFEEDTLLAMRWMLPLVARDALEVESFTRRVLASIGEAKAGFVYEEDLVQLGEPGAIPLLAFLQATPAGDQPAARHTAARVLSQTAGESMIDDLIDLLGDEDGEVRVSVAQALLRLTGKTHGVDPDEWRYIGRETRAALSAWHTWRDMR